jgi:hypothetical protein
MSKYYETKLVHPYRWLSKVPMLSHLTHTQLQTCTHTCWFHPQSTLKFSWFPTFIHTCPSYPNHWVLNANSSQLSQLLFSCHVITANVHSQISSSIFISNFDPQFYAISMHCSKWRVPSDTDQTENFNPNLQNVHFLGFEKVIIKWNQLKKKSSIFWVTYIWVYVMSKN